MKIVIFCSFFSVLLFAQIEDLPSFSSEGEVVEMTVPQQTEEVVKYEYKQEEYFDFTALEVKGELLTPGEIDIQSNRRVRFNASKHMRRDFDDYIREDLMDIH